MSENEVNKYPEAVNAVSARIDSFRAAGRTGNLDAFMANFAEDAVLMLDDRIGDANKEDIREYFEFLDDYYFDQIVSKDEIQICGDWAFARLTFDGYLHPKPETEGESERVVSRHFMMFHRDADDWKVIRDVWIFPAEKTN